ncbi:MAG: hypothetical protein LBM27_01610, partial [Lactobacillaceae bacterium]|nr:hypothetical protein [Lactobacillaceae bacterium]
WIIFVAGSWFAKDLIFKDAVSFGENDLVYTRSVFLTPWRIALALLVIWTLIPKYAAVKVSKEYIYINKLFWHFKYPISQIKNLSMSNTDISYIDVDGFKKWTQYYYLGFELKGDKKKFRFTHLTQKEWDQFRLAVIERLGSSTDSILSRM